jgi:hypothetical protein
MRALVNSGAEVSLLHKRKYITLSNQPKLNKKHNISLQSVSGNQLKVVGSVNDRGN